MLTFYYSLPHNSLEKSKFLVVPPNFSKLVLHMYTIAPKSQAQIWQQYNTNTQQLKAPARGSTSKKRR